METFLPSTLDAQSLKDFLDDEAAKIKANGGINAPVDFTVQVPIRQARLLLEELLPHHSVSIIHENGPLILRLHVRTPHLQAPISVDQLFESELFARQLEKFANDYVDSAMICEWLTEDDVMRCRKKIQTECILENHRRGNKPEEEPTFGMISIMVAELVTASILERMKERMDREKGVRATVVDEKDTHVMGHNLDAIFHLKDHAIKIFRGKHDFIVFTRKNEKLASRCSGALCVETADRAAVYFFDTKTSRKDITTKSPIQKNMRHMIHRGKNRDIYALQIFLIDNHFVLPSPEEAAAFPENVHVNKRTLTFNIAHILQNSPRHESDASVLAKIQRLGAMNGRNT